MREPARADGTRAPPTGEVVPREARMSFPRDARIEDVIPA
ncbi:hypothetical protein SGM_3375 [Streptomyces griseoaurantiacus M045]|uniref:Uncharacterized protein n=1 Tax=Streptomyces griseoaurantiacus M045 TaxID=996637 RepID=F3NJR1_9ACTN|nr:hypothetical protein SGM_3375 [Streptomyces griseoaurantiacus M045]